MSSHPRHPTALSEHHQPCCGVSTNLEDYFLTRRKFLSRVGMGLGALSLANIIDPANLVGAQAKGKLTAGPLSPRPSHFPGKAKSVIHIFASGAPSHIDTWDPKPTLTRMNGKTIPGSNDVALASPFNFSKYGQSGLEVSEVFAKTAAHADDLAVIRSMYTDIPAHEVATVFMNTGSVRISKPSMGSWLHRAPRWRTAERRRGQLSGGIPARSVSGHEHQHAGAFGAADDSEHPQHLRLKERTAAAARLR
jgi:hypothetical protein